MTVPVVVPDASVILKWVLPAGDEPDGERAFALRDAIAAGDFLALVPALWIYEVGNALARRFPDDAGRLFDTLLRFELTNAPRSPDWLDRVLDLTRRYEVTFYDAAYHAHAIASRGTFVTADARYVARAGAAGFVKLLSEWDGAGDPAS